MSAIIAKFRRDRSADRGLTFATTTDAQRQESRESWPGLDIFATVALLAVILVVCGYFLGGISNSFPGKSYERRLRYFCGKWG